ncbi:MAG: arylsulfatase [Luteolibacter sp.]|uniref:arylsulfatase n=1 Tax=Luteolibacter sp. TaxID=1962973 RepID=UPI003265FF2F
MKRNLITGSLSLLIASAAHIGLALPAQAQEKKPNIVLIVSDDFGYGDAGCYGGGEGRGMPTKNLDRMAGEGMQFMSFYAQPSCTPGRAAMQTGRFPNRSGMTTVAFQGQGGGLPKAEWTLASQLKTGGYKTYFTGKWHLGEADYALPNAHGYDVMKWMGIYHLNAYTYGDPTWFPDMPESLRAMFQKVTKGMMSGNAGETAKEDFKVNGQYVDKPGAPITIDGVTYPDGVVGIPYLDAYIEKAGLEFLDDAAKHPETPFFININFMKVHQPNMPHPDFEHKSMSKSKYADSVVENDARIGNVMTKIHDLGLDKGNTLVFWTTDNGAWQDVYPDAGYTPFRGTKGTDREGGNRVPAIAWMPGKIKPGTKNSEIIGGLDFMATFSSLAGLKLPEKDLEGQPCMFDSYDMTPVLFGTGPSPRETWSYFTENELLPGAIRYHNYKFQFNLRGDDGAHTGGLAVDTNLGWKGAEKYVATVPQIFDLWADPQERYDLFMNSFTERTWLAPVMGMELERIGKTFAKYPPRKLQSEGYDGPVTISGYQKFESVRKQLEAYKIDLQPGQ